MGKEVKKEGKATRCAPGVLEKKGAVISKNAKKFTTVPLDWNEVYYTNCPLVSASNVDQELGWTREELRK